MFDVTSRVVSCCALHASVVSCCTLYGGARSVAWELSRIDVALHLRSRTQGWPCQPPQNTGSTRARIFNGTPREPRRQSNGLDGPPYRAIPCHAVPCLAVPCRAVCTSRKVMFSRASAPPAAANHAGAVCGNTCRSEHATCNNRQRTTCNMQHATTHNTCWQALGAVAPAALTRNQYLECPGGAPEHHRVP